MGRFQFRLQKVMQARQFKEEIAKKNLATAQTALKEELQFLGRLEAFHRDAMIQMEAHIEGQVNVADVLLDIAYISSLSEEIAAQQRKIVQRTEEVERKRQMLVEASKDKKMLERIRERRYLAYLQEANRAEQAVIDEIAQRDSPRYHAIAE